MVDEQALRAWLDERIAESKTEEKEAIQIFDAIIACSKKNVYLRVVKRLDRKWGKDGDNETNIEDIQTGTPDA